MYFCVDCERFFENKKFYYETHGLDSPPYERIGICPNCRGDNFYKFDNTIEKIEIVENLLWAIMRLNILTEQIEGLFGSAARNENLEEVFGILQEMVTDMFDFMDIGIQKRILNLNNKKDLQKILLYLKGGL